MIAKILKSLPILLPGTYAIAGETWMTTGYSWLRATIVALVMCGRR